MGGRGSGRKAERPLIEDCCALRASELLKPLQGQPPLNRTAMARYRVGSQEFGQLELGIFIDAVQRGRLSITGRVGQGRWQTEVDQAVRLVATPLHFGGRRWWFICPLTKRKATALFLPPGKTTFASQKGWNLSYRSQRTSRDETIAIRWRAARDAIYADSEDGFPQRPKGMWDRTFDKRIAEFAQIDALRQGRMTAELVRMASRWPWLLDINDP